MDPLDSRGEPRLLQTDDWGRRLAPLSTPLMPESSSVGRCDAASLRLVTLKHHPTNY